MPIWKTLLEEYDEIERLDGEWLSGDSSSVKSLLGGEKAGNNPTDISKLETKRHAICEGNGIPISLCLTGANIHDINVLREMITNIVIEIPLYFETFVNLCLDKGYKLKDSEELIYENHMRSYIPEKGRALIIKDPKKKARR